MRQARVTIWWFLALTTLAYGVIAYGTERNYRLQPLAFGLRRPIAIALYAVAVLLFFGALTLAAKMRQTAMFVFSLALLDAVAISGLLAAMVVRDWRLYLPAWVLSLVGFVRIYPAGERNLTAE